MNVAEAVADLVVNLGHINAQVARDLSADDDTPGYLDDKEIDRLDAMLEQVAAAVERLRSMLTALRGKTRK